MAETPIPDSFLEMVRQIAKQHKEYSKMAPEAKLAELRKLQQRKKGLERATQIISTRIILLDNMPDVAEQMVVDDNISLQLLNELKRTGDVTYRELYKKVGMENNSVLGAVFYDRLSWLKRAQLVELVPNPSDWDAGLIKLTERGRTLQYVEQK